MLKRILNALRGCSCSCAGCRGVHGWVDHCRIERFGCGG
jgi:hypothetical protein